MKILFISCFLLAGLSCLTESKNALPRPGWKNFLRQVSRIADIDENEAQTKLHNMVRERLYSTRSASEPDSSVCTLCTAAMKTVVGIVDMLPSDNLILSMINDLCVESKLMPEDVCHGSIYSQGPVLLYIARRMDILPKLEEFCSILLKDDCDSSTGDEWLIALPDTPKPPNDDIPLPDMESSKLKILQISDIHLDPYYVEGSESKCDSPLCCRDIVESPTEPAGEWGAYHFCDTPLKMIDNLFAHIKETHQDIDYIMYIGDAPAHDFWNQDREEAMNQSITATNYIKKYFPDKQVYPVLGNHDNYPINCFPPKSADFSENEEFDITWLHTSIWEDWTGKFLPKELKNEDFFYSVSPYPGFRLITLHSNYLYAFNWWNFYYSEDPAGELAWLADELQAAEDAGDKVHIAMHQPPGIDALKTYSHNFWRIINRYENTVRGIFAGHTHKDELQIMFDGEEPDRAVSMVYVAGSITPYTDYNPAYRVITVDGNYPGSTYAVLDMDNYYLDLSQANSLGSTPKWEKLYSAKEDYQMENLNPSEWKKVIDNFINDKAAFDKYHKNLHRNSPTALPCEGNCRQNELCSILSGDFSNRQKCQQLPPFA